MTISLALLITATVMCGLGWAMIAYSGYATLRGWRIGAWYAADFSWLQGIAYLAIIGGLVFGYLAFGWWALIIVLVVGNITYSDSPSRGTGKHADGGTISSLAVRHRLRCSMDASARWQLTNN